MPVNPREVSPVCTLSGNDLGTGPCSPLRCAPDRWWNRKGASGLVASPAFACSSLALIEKTFANLGEAGRTGVLACCAHNRVLSGVGSRLFRSLGSALVRFSFPQTMGAARWFLNPTRSSGWWGRFGEPGRVDPDACRFGSFAAGTSWAWVEVCPRDAAAEDGTVRVSG